MEVTLENSNLSYWQIRYAANPEKYKIASKNYAQKEKERDIINWRRKQFYRMLKSKYKLTPEMYAIMVCERGGCCDLCKGQSDLHIDHCHNTNRIRGMLCLKCNTALGQLGDTYETILGVLEYCREPG